MAPDLPCDDPAPEDFADPDLAPVFATLPPALKRRFRGEFLSATRQTAPRLFARVEAEMFFRDEAGDHHERLKTERGRAARVEEAGTTPLTAAKAKAPKNPGGSGRVLCPGPGGSDRG